MKWLVFVTSFGKRPLPSYVLSELFRESMWEQSCPFFMRWLYWPYKFVNILSKILWFMFCKGLCFIIVMITILLFRAFESWLCPPSPDSACMHTPMMFWLSLWILVLCPLLQYISLSLSLSFFCGPPPCIFLCSLHSCPVMNYWYWKGSLISHVCLLQFSWSKSSNKYLCLGNLLCSFHFYLRFGTIFISHRKYAGRYYYLYFIALCYAVIYGRVE